MKISENKILITGGATGIGFAMAEAFLSAGSQVVVCGRRLDKLSEASKSLPEIKTIQADLSTAEGRSALVAQALTHLPNLNVVINSAGIMQPIRLDGPSSDNLEKWLRHEIEIDCMTPILLSNNLLSHLKQQPAAAIVNVTTGLVFAPAAAYPFYAVAKAGLHAYTQSLRFQLKDSQVKVFEVFPPAVDTALNTSNDPKISPKQVAVATVKGMQRDLLEIKVGQSRILAILSRISPNLAYSMINRES